MTKNGCAVILGLVVAVMGVIISYQQLISEIPDRQLEEERSTNEQLLRLRGNIQRLYDGVIQINDNIILLQEKLVATGEPSLRRDLESQIRELRSRADEAERDLIDLKKEYEQQGGTPLDDVSMPRIVQVPTVVEPTTRVPMSTATATATLILRAVPKTNKPILRAVPKANKPILRALPNIVATEVPEPQYEVVPNGDPVVEAPPPPEPSYSLEQGSFSESDLIVILTGTTNDDYGIGEDPACRMTGYSGSGIRMIVPHHIWMQYKECSYLPPR